MYSYSADILFMINKNDLYCVLLPGRRPPESLVEYYDKAYAMWHATWLATLNELDKVETLNSDDFTRQQEHLVLFFGDKAVGSASFGVLDIRKPYGYRDSVLKVWPIENLRQIGEDNKTILVCTYMTIDPEFRGIDFIAKLKVILGGVAICLFRESGFKVMLATMRNNRGMNTLAYQLGAQCVVRDAIAHGVAVDLVKFVSDETVLHKDKAVENYILDVWNNAISYNSATTYKKSA